MGYAERVLQPGETIAYRARLHWILMAPGTSLTLIAAVLAVAGLIAAPSGSRIGLWALSSVLLLIGATMLLRAWLRRLSTEIIVTNRRIILKTGLISRRSIEMNLDKIESVMVNQPIIGRLLDYGTLIIRGVGSGLEPITNVAAPLEFHRHVNASA